MVVKTDTSSQSRVYKYTYWAGRNMCLRTQLTGNFRMQINCPHPLFTGYPTGSFECVQRIKHICWELLPFSGHNARCHSQNSRVQVHCCAGDMNSQERKSGFSLVFTLNNHQAYPGAFVQCDHCSVFPLLFWSAFKIMPRNRLIRKNRSPETRDSLLPHF